MTSVDNTSRQFASILERLTKVETALETERPHLATKADLERQTRLLVMWMIATQIAMAALMLTVFGNGSVG